MENEHSAMRAAATGWPALMALLVLPMSMGVIAAALTFIVAWPKTVREGVLRVSCTVLTSFVGGPFLVILVKGWWPQVFGTAREVAALYGLPPEAGFLLVAAPLQVMAGLPTWWIMAACALWFDRRKEMDIGQLAIEAAETARNVRKSL